jgi:hypothetical protein
MNDTQIHDVINSAFQAARTATKQYLATHGDVDACGFVWVSIRPATKKVAKILKNSYGAERIPFEGGLNLWNPSYSPVQSISAKEEGAYAFVNVMRKAFPDVTFTVGSRMD